MDIADQLRLDMETEKKEKPSVNPDNQIIVSKFMLVIEQYPSGKIYPKIFPIGETRKGMAKKKRAKKQIKQVKLDGAEEY